MFNYKNLVFKFLLCITDLLLIHLGYLLVFFFKFGWRIPEENETAYLITWPWFTLSALALLYFYKLYSGYRWRWGEIFASLVCVVFFQAIVALAISFWFRGFAFPRSVLLIAPFVQLLLLAGWRRIAWHLERRMQNTSRVVVVGQAGESVALAEKLERATAGAIKVLGVVVSDPSFYEDNCDDQVKDAWPLLGDVQHFSEYLASYAPEQVFVCPKLSQEQKAKVVCDCVAMDKKVLLVPDLYEIMLAQAKLEQVDDVPIFAVGRLAIPEEFLFIKRLMDIILAALALIITLPFNILVTMMIKLDSKGPVLYKQKRLSLQGKPFYLYKFRTMVANAEQDSGPILATEDDPRITRVGRWLRNTRYDEVPQLFNVLKGDMSVVGPRPERPFFVNEFIKEKPEYAYRMNVKSGITGLAQIAGKYSTSPENKLKYDLLYTKSYSISADLAILLQTVKVMLMKDKAS